MDCIYTFYEIVNAECVHTRNTWYGQIIAEFVGSGFQGVKNFV